MSTVQDLIVYSITQSLKVFLPCESSFYNVESELFIHIIPMIAIPKSVYTIAIFSTHPLIRSCAEELFKNSFFTLKLFFNKNASSDNQKLLICGGVPGIILICALTKNNSIKKINIMEIEN